jgi:hypothetical protein
MTIEFTQVNPQPDVRRNAENAVGWEYKEEAAFLYTKAIQLRERLIDPIARVDRKQLPDPVIGFENLRNHKVLACYHIFRDPVGLNCRIDFNTEQYKDEEGKKVWSWGRWAQLETLSHEYVHLWTQQVLGIRPTHGKEFIEKSESIGLHPLPGIGCHVAVADAPFSILMREWGIERPADVPSAIDWTRTGGIRIDWFKAGKETRGKSSLTKWSCGCQNVRVGTKEFFASCTRCKNEFVRVDANQKAPNK